MSLDETADARQEFTHLADGDKGRPCSLLLVMTMYRAQGAIASGSASTHMLMLLLYIQVAITWRPGFLEVVAKCIFLRTLVDGFRLLRLGLVIVFLLRLFTDPQQ
jgi:hypothetical protein